MNPLWQPLHAYSLNAVVVDANGNVQRCDVAGTSGVDPPQFATAVDSTTPDGLGALSWTCVVSYSATSTYASVNDMVGVFPFRDLVQLSNEDPTSQTIDQARLLAQLTMASRVVDSYLEARFALPLPRTPMVLVSTTLDIAMYRLQCLRPLHDLKDARLRYADAIEFLTKVNQGKLSLALDTTSAPAASASPTATTLTGGMADQLIRTEQGASRGLDEVFDRHSMRRM